MRNVTISISESVEKIARVIAAKKSMSLSRFVSEILEDIAKRESSKSDVLQAFLKQEPYLLTKGKTFKRDELYDRKVLR